MDDFEACTNFGQTTSFNLIVLLIFNEKYGDKMDFKKRCATIHITRKPTHTKFESVKAERGSKAFVVLKDGSLLRGFLESQWLLVSLGRSCTVIQPVQMDAALHKGTIKLTSFKNLTHPKICVKTLFKYQL